MTQIPAAYIFDSRLWGSSRSHEVGRSREMGSREVNPTPEVTSRSPLLRALFDITSIWLSAQMAPTAFVFM